MDAAVERMWTGPPGLDWLFVGSLEGGFGGNFDYTRDVGKTYVNF